jgi:universal stress protein family protein
MWPCKGVEHEVVIGQSNIWEATSNLVKQKEIDLIVLGSRGRTGLGKALLGSVAEQISAASAVSRVDRGAARERAVRRDATKLREILCAPDLAADFPVAAPYAISLAQETGAKEGRSKVHADPDARRNRPDDRRVARDGDAAVCRFQQKRGVASNRFDTYYYESGGT